MFNGHLMTWTQFKDFWKKKDVGGWLYDDLKDNENYYTKKKFKSAWRRAGPLYCEKKKIKYVDINYASQQQ